MLQFETRHLHTYRLGIALALCAALSLAAPAGAQSEGKHDALVQLSDAYVDIVEKTSPAVVFIKVGKTVKSAGSPFGGSPGDLNDLFQHFFGRGFSSPHGRQPSRPMPDRVIEGQGTGVLISPEGYIVTNHHVVGDADDIKVRMSDNKEYEAELIGSDPDTEIAVIKIEGSDFPSLPLGDSDKLRVGEWVIAIGNPFGLSHSVTSGIVSAQGRGIAGIADISNFIQTDAAINPGNSGGPLLNLRGEVVGVNTAIYSRSGGYMGIGFAIPINMVKNIRDQLIETGEVTHGFLGVLIQDVTQDLAKWFETEDVRGALIADVGEDSPAEEAGLKRDDIVLKVDGHDVEDSRAFRSRIATTAPGKKVKLTILRNGKELTKKVTIGKRPADGQFASKSSRATKKLGMTVQNLTDELAQRFGYEDLEGVLVSEVEQGAPAARKGIKSGDLIQEVNRQSVRNTREFNEALADVKGRESILLRVSDGQLSRYVALEAGS